MPFQSHCTAHSVQRVSLIVHAASAFLPCLCCCCSWSLGCNLVPLLFDDLPLALVGIDLKEVVENDKHHGCGTEEDGYAVQVVVRYHLE